MFAIYNNMEPKVTKFLHFVFLFILYANSLINRYNRANKSPSLSICESSSQCIMQKSGDVCRKKSVESVDV